MLIVMFIGDLSVAEGGGGFDDITGVTYAGTSMILAIKLASSFHGTAGGSRFLYLYYLLNPTGGSANNVVISCTNNHYLLAVAADYTGVRQAGQPDATATANTTTNSTTLTTNLTTVAANAWAIIGFENPTASPPASGSNTTLRITGSTFSEPSIFDTNGPLSIGAHALVCNVSPTNSPLESVAASFAADLDSWGFEPGGMFVSRPPWRAVGGTPT